MKKKNGGAGLLSEKTEALRAELNERTEAATSSYSAEVDFLQYISCGSFRFLWLWLYIAITKTMCTAVLSYLLNSFMTEVVII